MKKHLQVFLSLLLCAVLMLSCGCTFNFFGGNDKDKDKDKEKNPSSSQQDGTDSSDEDLTDDGSSEDEGLGDDLFDNSSDEDDKDDNNKGSSSKKEYDKYSPVGSSGNIMPTVKDDGENDEEEDEEEVVTDSVKYPDSVNAAALNKTDLFNKYDTALFTEKIWEGKTVYYETICFEQDKNGLISNASLLYEPDQIIAVRSADMTVTYAEGSDFTVDGRVVSRPRSSKIPYAPYKEFFTFYNAEEEPYNLANDLNTSVIFRSDGRPLQKRIVTVFYTHKDGWRGSTMPESQESELSRTLNKLKNGQDVKIVFHGDSITAGFTTSGNKEKARDNGSGAVLQMPCWGNVNFEPKVPAYPTIVKQALQNKFPNATITHVNTAAPGGSCGAHGINRINLVTEQNPDVVVIAFGMNDSWMDSGNNYGKYYYKNYYIQMMESILEKNPNCEFIFVPCMLPNMNIANFLKNDAAFDSHEQHLYEIQEEYPDNHIAVVPTTSLWRDLYALGKKPSDYTGSMDNHPNDWGHSVYAQLLLNAFGL